MKQNESEKDYGVSIDGFRSLADALTILQGETIPPDYWHGYLCAIALSPTAVPEAEWIGALIHRESDEHTVEVEEALRESLKRVLESLDEKRFKPYFPGDDSDWRNCETVQWCEGFLTASHHWPGDLQDLAGGELVALTLPIILFHNPEEFFSKHSAHLSANEQEEMLDRSFAFLPEGLYEIPILWQEVLKEELPGEE